MSKNVISLVAVASVAMLATPVSADPEDLARDLAGLTEPMNGPAIGRACTGHVPGLPMPQDNPGFFLFNGPYQDSTLGGAWRVDFYIPTDASNTRVLYTWGAVCFLLSKVEQLKDWAERFAEMAVECVQSTDSSDPVAYPGLVLECIVRGMEPPPV